MFYKQDENTGEWYSGNEVHFPDGKKITSENKESRDGWEWHDEEPEDFKNKNNTENNDL
jgi:hypothetical protein